MSSSDNKKKAKAPPPEEKGEQAPIWIISFADMISLLMAFFVMLLTMAHTKSGKLCNPGEGIFERTIFGFKSSISGLGVPGLFGKASETESFEYGKSHYNMTGDNNDQDQRTIDASEEKLRRLFNQLQKGMKTYARPPKNIRSDYTVTPIAFQQGQAGLDEAGKQFLRQFIVNLEESGNPCSGLYVIGLAPEALPELQKLPLAVRRAQAAGDFLKSIIPAERSIPVYCWGSSSIDRWVGTGNAGSIQPEILIAVAHASE